MLALNSLALNTLLSQFPEYQAFLNPSKYATSSEQIKQTITLLPVADVEMSRWVGMWIPRA